LVHARARRATGKNISRHFLTTKYLTQAKYRKDYMIDITHPSPELPVGIIGEAIAGEAAAALKQVKALVKNITSNTFDLAEALHKVRSNKYYAPKHNTFKEYANSIDIKIAKAYYLSRLVDVLEQAGVPREQYEPVGIAKLRLITRLDVKDKEGKPAMHEGKPISLLIKDLIETADKFTPEDLELKVKTIQGLVGENASGGWVNFPVTFAQRAEWEKAVALAQNNIGSVAQDEEGNYKDASIGACAQVIAQSFILDPNNFGEEGFTMEAINVSQ
jgi:hypothetical protein